MAATSNENELSKENLMKKLFAQMLGSTKIVYGRDEHYENTIIIRNFYKPLNANKKVFGISNEANIRSLFLSALMLIKVDYRHLKPKLKFVRKEELEILQKVIFEMTDAIHTVKENLEE